MCATARIMRSKSARSSRRERQGQAQAHRARPQPEGAGEGAPQDATAQGAQVREALSATGEASGPDGGRRDRKSTRLNSSHDQISYAVFCLKKKEHTSELQSRSDLVCRLLLEKK